MLNISLYYYYYYVSNELTFVNQMNTIENYTSGMENGLDNKNVLGLLHGTKAKTNSSLASKYARNIVSILATTQTVSLPKTNVTTPK